MISSSLCPCLHIIKGDAQAGIRMKLILPKSKVNAEAMMGEEMVFVHTVHTEKKKRSQGRMKCTWNE